MVIQHREPSDRDREDLSKFLQASIDPIFAVEVTFPQQARASHAARQAVVPASDRHIDQVGASHRHGVKLLEWIGGSYQRQYRRSSLQ
jgi:hypothetical protein